MRLHVDKPVRSQVGDTVPSQGRRGSPPVPVEVRATVDDRRGYEDGCRDTELAEYRRRVLERVAIAVIERDAHVIIRDRAYEKPERGIEPDDARAGLEERFHLTTKRIGAHGQDIPVVRDPVVAQDSYASLLERYGSPRENRA